MNETDELSTNTISLIKTTRAVLLSTAAPVGEYSTGASVFFSNLEDRDIQDANRRAQQIRGESGWDFVFDQTVNTEVRVSSHGGKFESDTTPVAISIDIADAREETFTVFVLSEPAFQFVMSGESGRRIVSLLRSPFKHWWDELGR